MQAESDARSGASRSPAKAVVWRPGREAGHVAHPPDVAERGQRYSTAPRVNLQFQLYRRMDFDVLPVSDPFMQAKQPT